MLRSRQKRNLGGVESILIRNLRSCILSSLPADEIRPRRSDVDVYTEHSASECTPGDYSTLQYASEDPVYVEPHSRSPTTKYSREHAKRHRNNPYRRRQRYHREETSQLMNILLVIEGFDQYTQRTKIYRSNLAFATLNPLWSLATKLQHDISHLRTFRLFIQRQETNLDTTTNTRNNGKQKSYVYSEYVNLDDLVCLDIERDRLPSLFALPENTLLFELSDGFLYCTPSLAIWLQTNNVATIKNLTLTHHLHDSATTTTTPTTTQQQPSSSSSSFSDHLENKGNGNKTNDNNHLLEVASETTIDKKNGKNNSIIEGNQKKLIPTKPLAKGYEFKPYSLQSNRLSELILLQRKYYKLARKNVQLRKRIANRMGIAKKRQHTVHVEGSSTMRSDAAQASTAIDSTDTGAGGGLNTSPSSVVDTTGADTKRSIGTSKNGTRSSSSVDADANPDLEIFDMFFPTIHPSAQNEKGDGNFANDFVNTVSSPLNHNSPSIGTKESKNENSKLRKKISPQLLALRNNVNALRKEVQDERKKLWEQLDPMKVDLLLNLLNRQALELRQASSGTNSGANSRGGNSGESSGGNSGERSGVNSESGRLGGKRERELVFNQSLVHKYHHQMPLSYRRLFMVESLLSAAFNYAKTTINLPTNDSTNNSGTSSLLLLSDANNNLLHNHCPVNENTLMATLNHQLKMKRERIVFGNTLIHNIEEKIAKTIHLNKILKSSMLQKTKDLVLARQLKLLSEVQSLYSIETKGFMLNHRKSKGKTSSDASTNASTASSYSRLLSWGRSSSSSSTNNTGSTATKTGRAGSSSKGQSASKSILHRSRRTSSTTTPRGFSPSASSELVNGGFPGERGRDRPPHGSPSQVNVSGGAGGSFGSPFDTSGKVSGNGGGGLVGHNSSGLGVPLGPLPPPGIGPGGFLVDPIGISFHDSRNKSPHTRFLMNLTSQQSPILRPIRDALFHYEYSAGRNVTGPRTNRSHDNSSNLNKTPRGGSMGSLASERASKDSLLYTIRSLSVPSSREALTMTASRLNDEKTSTALGYVCHLVRLLATYFCVPLRYPLAHYGSRSFIIDEVPLAGTDTMWLGGTKVISRSGSGHATWEGSGHTSYATLANTARWALEYPLYLNPKTDRSRFLVALICLEKNVEQLVRSRGIPRDEISPHWGVLRKLKALCEKEIVLLED
eukprot:g2326.t1